MAQGGSSGGTPASDPQPEVILFSPGSGTQLPDQPTLAISVLFNQGLLESSVTDPSHWSIQCAPASSDGLVLPSGIFSVSTLLYDDATHTATVSLSRTQRPATGEICTLSALASITNPAGTALLPASASYTVP